MREQTALLNDVANSPAQSVDVLAVDLLAIELDLGRESGSIRPMIKRRRVDLPQPLGPISAVVLPRAIESLSDAARQHPRNVC